MRRYTPNLLVGIGWNRCPESRGIRVRIALEYTNSMKIEYGPAKNEWNIKERGLSFDLAADLGRDTALVTEDIRN